MKKIILFICLGFGALACEETVTLDLDQVESAIAIEGLVTNQTRAHYVRVTNTIDFYAEGSVTGITNATVTVSDSEGNVFNYEHNPGDHPQGVGYYFSNQPYEGVIGRTYRLEVSVDGTTYTAEDKLMPVTEIDSLTVALNEDEFEDPEDEGYFYEVLFYAHEPQETKDYYLFKFYRNDTTLRDDINDIYFSDDDLLAEEINGIPTAGFFKEGDVGRVEMYSITLKGYLYYNDLINLLQSDGGMFGSPPVNPRTNLSGNALGFFQVSAVTSDTIEVKE